jgi:hypothetical protein
LFIWEEGSTPFIHQFFIYWEEGYTNFHPFRRGLQNFSSMKKSVTQLFIHQQDGDAVALGLLNSWLCLLTRTWSLVTRNT